MLEMMPGSIIDKTNNNLSNLACTHSTIEQKTDPDEDKMTDATKIVTNLIIPSALDETFSKDTLEGCSSSTECNVISNQLSNTLENNNETSIIGNDVSQSNLKLHEEANCLTSDIDATLQKTTDCDITSQNETGNSIIPQESSTNNIETQEIKYNKDSSESNCSTLSINIFQEKESNIHQEISESVISQEMTNQYEITDDKTEESTSVTPENACDSNLTCQSTSENNESDEQLKNNILTESLNENTSESVVTQENVEGCSIPAVNIISEIECEEKTEYANNNSELLQNTSEPNVIPLEKVGSTINSSVISKAENTVEEKSSNDTFQNNDVLLKSESITFEIPKDKAVVDEVSMVNTVSLDEKCESNISTIISTNNVEPEDNSVDDSLDISTNEEKLENQIVVYKTSIPSLAHESVQTFENIQSNNACPQSLDSTIVVPSKNDENMTDSSQCTIIHKDELNDNNHSDGVVKNEALSFENNVIKDEKSEYNNKSNISTIEKMETEILIEQKYVSNLDSDSKNDVVQKISESEVSCEKKTENFVISSDIVNLSVDNIACSENLETTNTTNNLDDDIDTVSNISSHENVLSEKNVTEVSELKIKDSVEEIPENINISDNNINLNENSTDDINCSEAKENNSISIFSKTLESEFKEELICNTALEISQELSKNDVTLKLLQPNAESPEKPTTNVTHKGSTCSKELLKCISTTEELIDQKLLNQQTKKSDISVTDVTIHKLLKKSTKESKDKIENKSNTEKKLLLLEKHNVTLQNVLPIIKHLKRQTKDKKSNRVLSLKLNRFYFKSNKPKWSKHMIAEKKRKLKNLYLQKKNEEKSTQNILKPHSSSESEYEQDEIVSSCQGSDDVRNKIKHQLELLRQQRRPMVIPKENTIDVDYMKQPEKVIDNVNETITKIPAESRSKLVSANLDDVVLSKGDGSLSIVSVVGGYISDEDINESNQNSPETDAAMDDEPSIIQPPPLNKGVSITDILLKRELSLNNLLDTHIIKPSKTNDITKIKGWRTKQFAAVSVLESDDTKNKLLEEQDKVEETILKKKESENDQASNTIENPLPSTSFGCCESADKNIPQITTDSKSDNILKQGESTNLENNRKSAFVSDMLDTFLSNHAQLKISYEVPKLVAEEAITKPVSEMPVRNNEYLNVVSKSSYRKKSMPGKVLKPKTLAEKRRMMEQDRLNQLLQNMETNESVYLKKLAYCEKKNKTEVVKHILDTMMDEKVPFSRHCWNIATKFDENARQFVIVNGNKIRIIGSPGGEDIIMPNEVTRVSSNKEYCPPLILNRKRKIFYKPGPLSKKHKLMIGESCENWECRVMKMPKIKLVVCPEEGKRLPLLAEQYIQLYRGEKGLISDELAKFAVSAVRSQEEVKRKFEFDIPYQNMQDKLLIRKKKISNQSQDKSYINKNEEIEIHPPLIPKSDFTDVNVDKCIKNIMSDMLACIENHNLDKIIIKDDPDDNSIIIKEEKHADRPPSPIDPRVQAIIKRSNTRKRGTTLELRRLNVQVIEVDVKEEDNEADVCTKDFCKLGCVCKSLRGNMSLVPEHCGRESCMLQCNCSFGNSQRGHHSITLPAGTDLFSASTVVRLQDEVKKNLAKEEREFAQTVIKANNQTIMVGGGARERQRRIPKVPKKYSNFVSKSKSFSYEKMISVGLLEEDEDFEVQMGKAVIQRAKEAVRKETDQRVVEVELKKSVPIWNKKDKLSNKGNQEIRDCYIKLNKLLLQHIAPWCMVHNLYKCHCDGRALFEQSAPMKSKEETVTNVDESNEYISYASRCPNRYFPENNSTVTVTDPTDRYCARTRALATNFYQARNKSQRFKAQYARMRQEGENQPGSFETSKSIEDINVGEPEVKVRKIKTKRVSRQNNHKGENSLNNSQDLLVPKTNKKITLVNVDDILNTSKKEENPKPIVPNPCQVVSAASFIDYDRSFMALLTPSTEWLDRFHKMLNLNLNTVIRQIRLLEWATLVRRHNVGTLQLWFNSKKYNNIILTEDKRRPSKHHINIKLFETTPPMANYKLPEIITSLFSNTLPGVAKKDTETYVILVYNGIFWEARGTIVLNDTYEMCLQKLGHKATPVSILDPTLSYNQTDKSVQPKTVSTNSNIVIRSTPSISVEVVPRNAATTSTSNKPVEYSGLEITKIPLSNQNTESSEKQNGSILAPLPTGFGLNRWFMLILKNDFSVLRISFSNFHIKYTHLMTAIQTARKNQKTVRIRSQEKHIENPNNFGVYAIPAFGDRIFFGPYDNESSHGLETFRYVNGKLVNTKIYNKMRGNIDKNTTGIWYYHSSTLQNNLILEPQNDNRSSGSDCSTEMTSAEKAVKPQIEFVDLTENDSDNEKDKNDKPSSNVDSVFNVFSADFTKKVSGDITIEPVYNNTPRAAPVVKEINDIVIQPIRNDNINTTSVSNTTSVPNTNTVSNMNTVSNVNTVSNMNTVSNINTNMKTEPIAKEQECKIIRKRKSASNSSKEPPKKQPTLIDSINLDDDDGSLLKRKSPKRGNFDTSNLKQMPALCPINSLQNLNNEVLRKRKIIYVITNIPGIGYFEIFLTEKRNMRLHINGKANMFPTISTALTWLNQLFRRFIFFVPSDLKVKFSILESTEVPEMPKFNEDFLNGRHIMCEKGIFDLIRMNTEDMENLDFNEQETSKVLAHKCEILIERNIRVLGNCMMGAEEARKLTKARILQIAPKKIELLESRESFLLDEKRKLQNDQANLISKINAMLGSLPEHVKKMYQDKVNSITNFKAFKFVSDQNVGECIKDESSKSTSSILPGGKICKIVDGKMFVMDAPTQIISTIQTPILYNMQHLRPIAPKTQYEMLVPIAGLQTPVTLIGVPPQQVQATSILLSNNRKNIQSQRVVDLTDD